MKTVVLTLATTPTPLPDGAVFAGYVFALGALSVVVASASASFADVAPGTYSATAQAVDASNSPFGPIASATVVVPDDAAMFDAPSTLTFALQ